VVDFQPLQTAGEQNLNGTVLGPGLNIGRPILNWTGDTRNLATDGPRARGGPGVPERDEDASAVDRING
jgi:hypothetical protein